MANGQKTGGGSRKGRPNKSTVRAREAIAAFVDENAERLQGWLDEIAETDGALSAFRAFADLLEYHVPKLSRAELTGAGGGSIKIETIKRVIVDPCNRGGPSGPHD